MKIKKAVVKKEINTDEDIEIYQNTKFEKNVRCRKVISVGESWDINARNIDAWNIDAWNINAWNIICEKRIKKEKKAKTFCRIFVDGKSKLKRKEHKC